MNKDQVKGRAQVAAGKVKELTGKAVGSKKLQGKGLIEEAGGKARADYGDAKSRAKKGS
jgi:uncharacterized protein YjbJ (UPF0337 family)